MDKPDHTAERDALERMLLGVEGVLDWDHNLHTHSSGPSTRHPETVQHDRNTRSLPTADRSLGEEEGLGNPRSSTPKPKHGAEGQKSEKMQQMRARHREAQARYRAKHREQKTELESDIKRIKSSIEGGAGELHVLKSQKASLVQRLSNASAALQATLEISKLLPVGLSLDSIGTTSLRLQGMPSPGPSGHSFPIDDVRANPSVIFQPLHPPRPTPSSNSHHLPISHEPILNASSAARSSAAQGALGSLNILSLSSSMHSTTTPSNTTLRSLVHKFQRAEAARVDANVAEVTWYAQMAIEVAPSTRLSYSSTLMSPECVASNVLSGLLCRLEFALAAKLLRLQSASGWPASQDGAVPRTDSGEEQGRESPTNAASKRRRCNAAGPLTASGNLSSSLSRSYGSHGSIPCVPDAPLDPSPYANLVAPGGAFSAAASEVASGGPSQWAQLQQQRSRPLSLTKERMELMRVRCGVNSTHPMRAAVKAAYRTVVARYAAQGRLPMHEVTKVLEKVLEKEETVLRSLWEAQVERRGTGNASEGRSNIAGAVNDLGTAAEALFRNIPGTAGTPVAVPPGSHLRGAGGRRGGAYSSWAAGGDEQAFYEASSEHMIAMLVSARAEMMRLVQELPVKASLEGPAAAPVFDEALQDTLLATATAAAIGSSLAVGDATEVLLQLRIDSMLPLMSTLEFDTTHADLYKTMALSEQQKRSLADGWLRWERGKQSLASLSAQAANFLNSLPHELTIPQVFLAHLSPLSTTPSRPSQAAIATASDANIPLSLALQQLPRQAGASADAAAASLPLWAATPAADIKVELSEGTLGAAMSAPSSRAPLLGGPSGQIAMSSDMQLQMLMQQHMPGSAAQLAEPLSPWPSLQLDDVCTTNNPGIGVMSTTLAADNPFNPVHCSAAHSQGVTAPPTYRSRMAGIHSAQDVSVGANTLHCRCNKSLAPGCFGRFSSDASQLNSGMQFIGQCSGHMSCAAQAFQDLVAAHKADKEHLIDVLDLQVPHAVLTAPQVARVLSQHILEDSAPLDFLALCQLASSQLHRQELFRHPFFHC